MTRTVLALVSCLILGGILLPGAIGYAAIAGIEGTVEDPRADQHELAGQMSETTAYLQALATGILGMMAFLLSDRISAYWSHLSQPRRKAVAWGGVLCTSSLGTGFVIHWAVLSLLADNVIRGGMDRLLVLSALQGGELTAGLIAIGTPLVSAILMTEGKPRKSHE
jgi:hypothetical protein